MNLLFFPFLFFIYPVFFLFAENFDQTQWRDFFPVFVFLIFLSFFSYFILKFFFKNSIKAAFFLFFFSVLFFSYGHIQSAIYGELLVGNVSRFASRKKIDLEFLFNILLSSFYFCMAYFGFHKIKKSQANFKKFVPVLNVFVLCLFLGPTLKFLNHLNLKKPKAVIDKPKIEVDPVVVEKITQKLGYLPDIYYIILDGYARHDVLEKIFKFKNNDFIDGLKQRGFQVPDQSYSNYFWTFLSLSSSLNMKHILFLTDLVGKETRSRKIPYEMIRNNEVAQFLKRFGYYFYHFASTWGATYTNPYADFLVKCDVGFMSNEFLRVFLETTWLRVNRSFVSVDLAKCHLANLSKLGEMGKEISPKFVFAHFVPPHHPYLFDRTGKILRNATVSNQFDFQQNLWYKKKKYVDQLIYMNHRILSIVDSLLKSSKNPPIILIQSDHGPHVQKKRLLSRSARLANLVALYHPKRTTLIPNRNTPVNHFRRIFNEYFDANLELQSEESYFSHPHRPYDFQEHKPNDQEDFSSN